MKLDIDLRPDPFFDKAATMSPGNDAKMPGKDVSINPLHPSVEDKLDQKVKDIYMKYQGRVLTETLDIYLANRLRADQVAFEEFDADRSRYIFPRDKVTSPRCPVETITTHRVPVASPPGDIDVRIYHPSADKKSNELDGGNRATSQLPLYVNFHGGGFVLGGLDDDDPFCRQMCQNVPCLVANVAYRLAPEFPHPVPAADSLDALRWLTDNTVSLGIDAERIAVGGFSAGGSLAAMLAQKARTEASRASHGRSTALPSLVLQLLVVPVLDARYIPLSSPTTMADAASLDTPYESYRSCAFAPMLPMQRLVWFYRLWLGADPEAHAKNARDIEASPLAVCSDAELQGLAPASIHCAEIDPLLSEAECYHARLIKAGTPSCLTVYKGMVHPFVQWDGELVQGQEMVRNAVSALRKAFRIVEASR